MEISVPTQSFQWALPIMRAGYAGRGIVYIVVAGLSLWAIFRGGDAEGTGSAFSTLSASPFGWVLLALIVLGMAAYAIWRILDAAMDLEDYGTDAKGLIARAGMVVTGLVHSAIGVLAVSLIIGASRSGGGIEQAVAAVLRMPGGRWIIAFAAICTLGAALYYLQKALRRTYRDKLRASHFTRNWDWAMQAGVASQGVVVGVIGGFLAMAALRADSTHAGGMGQAFDWLGQQPFGQALVILLCLGLLGFAFFCFVNAGYRIIPRIAEPGTESLGEFLKRKARAAT
ncbi:MAG: DUF1206 domain-containing protein [Roseicyclus sp.]|nr:DUF1206 domain-containing protein [Roseicyclus sp.]MBO6626076.1 DUF1206 domain-containing protein [Roseicyclus sp.]MBO6924123.1 DUF1206 domain-containing protein [Roseicyclus sp.]